MKRRSRSPQPEIELMLEDPKGTIGEGLQIEVGIAREGLFRHFRSTDVLDDIEPNAT
jgi:hypothetical protein